MSQDARLQTLEAREELVAARRESGTRRDARRLELARDFAGRGVPFGIKRKRGFASFGPGQLPGANAVVDAANAVFDGIGHDELVARHTKPRKPFLARGMVWPKHLTFDSPYIQFGLGKDLVESLSAYLGVVPILQKFDLWYSIPQGQELTSSQLWHMDHDDTTIVKVWVYCDDIGVESGPLTLLTAAASAQLAEEIHYDMGADYHIPDETIQAARDSGVLVELVGPRGSVALTDTCRCFHMGSRVAPGAPPRRVAVYTYLTPYAFQFDDHREQATYRHLALRAETELQRLVLGAD